MKTLCSVAVSMIIASSLLAGTKYYVKPSGNNASAGTSWGAAFATLQHADSTAASGDTIWVAAGTYYPSTSNTSAYFQLKSGVVYLGGFNGTETLVGQRDWQTNVTTLSGDINNDGTLAGNSNQVVYALLANSSTVLDGFVITGGNSSSDGGGISLLVASPTLSNLTITGNHAASNGGGLCINSGTPTVTNCSFIGNAANYGGGIYNYSGGVPVISACKFQNNSATTFGGGFYNSGNTLTVHDLLFDGNHATTGGGGFYEDHGSTYVNLTLYGNTSKYGGAVFVTGAASINIINTITWNDTATTSGAEIYSTTSGAGTTISHSLIQGGVSGPGIAGPGAFTDGGHNLDLDPLFTDSSAHDFTLTTSSPAVDSGSNAAVSASTDLAGSIRISHGNVDMGAYEYQGAPLAVEMSSLAANCTGNSVRIQWTTATETDNFGFEIERQAIAGRSSASSGVSPNLQWSSVGFVKGAGSSTWAHEYSFEETGLAAGLYVYRIKQIDRNGSFKYSQEVQVEVGLAPKVFALSQNYPNPFNPTTTIRFTIPTNGRVVLSVHNTLGQELEQWNFGILGAGGYSQQLDFSRFASGVYFYRITVVGENGEKFVAMKKMMMVK